MLFAAIHWTYRPQYPRALVISDPRIAQTFYSIVEETVNSSEFPVILFGTCEQFKTVSEVIREMALHEVVFEVSVTPVIFNWNVVGDASDCVFLMLSSHLMWSSD